VENEVLWGRGRSGRENEEDLLTHFNYCGSVPERGNRGKICLRLERGRGKGAEQLSEGSRAALKKILAHRLTIKRTILKSWGVSLEKGGVICET